MPGIFIGNTIANKRNNSWSSYWMQRHPELKTYVTGLSFALSTKQIIALGAFIEELKTGLNITSLTEAFDTIKVYSGETEESSLKNIVKDLNHSSLIEGVTHSPYSGFKGNGTTGIINTGYNLSTDSEKATQNDFSAGFVSLSYLPAANSTWMGAGSTTPYFLFQVRYTGDKSYVEMSNNIGIGISNRNNTHGFHSASRKASANYQIYKDALLLGSEAVVSGAFKNLIVSELGYTKDDTTKAGWTGGRIAFSYIGKGFTADEMIIIKNAFYNYYDLCNKIRKYKFSDVHIVAHRDNKVLSFDATTLLLSIDSGLTYSVIKVTSPVISIITFGHIFSNGNILFADDTKCYLSTDNLATYSEVSVTGIDGNPFVAGTLNNFRSVGYENVSIGGTEVLVWGGYITGGTAQNSNINIWYSVNNGLTVKSCYKAGITGTPISSLIARHIHQVTFNSIDNSFWVTTGDGTDGCNWIKGIYNSQADSWAWTKVAGDNEGGSGANVNNTWYKATGLVFKDGYVYWGSDSDDPIKRGIFRTLYSNIANSGTYEKVYEHAERIVSIGSNGSSIIASISLTKKIASSTNGVDWIETVVEDDVNLNVSVGCYFAIRQPNVGGYYLMDIISDTDTIDNYTQGKVVLFKP